ncbi:hypothetical protein BDU57DRAFT_188263 [Ampelomyces quisqualis]|uniref:Uncharacterized protein n=1 Tax=Ampelomyces quisqualis TaxID=50730 RepID=A0A6A5QW97_AMPQU|nr:hypothetical protein BDU57DRAFT_188263 [Ampelomyces quisqualis]
MTTTIYDTGRLYSAFLSLPTELRCEIYDYLIVDSQSITVGAGYVTVFGNRILDRARKHDILGLPLDLVPLVRQTRDASLLSVATPPEIAIDDGSLDKVGHYNSALGMPAPLALQLTCRQISDEMTDYMRRRKLTKIALAQSASPSNTNESFPEGDEEGLSLYVTYPYGVLVLKEMYPYLLKQARRVYISGHYTTPKTSPLGSPTSSHSSFSSEDEGLTPSSSFAVAESFGAIPAGRPHRAHHTVRRSSPYPIRPRLRLSPPPPRTQRQISDSFPVFNAHTNDLAPQALTLLIRTLFPPTPTQCTLLSARILYPGDNAYSSVWSDNNSPITHVLRNVCGGKIDMQVMRGDAGTGLILSARPKPDGRIVSTSWENWRREGVRGRGLGVRELDGFLVGSGEGK